jgi:hypothetical protein
MAVPPVLAVYHLSVPVPQVAFKLTVPPEHTAVALLLTADGAAGKAATVTATVAVAVQLLPAVTLNV